MQINRQVLLITCRLDSGAEQYSPDCVTWLNDSQYWLFKVGEATVVFLLFLSLSLALLQTHSRLSKRKKRKIAPFLSSMQRMDRHVFP